MAQSVAPRNKTVTVEDVAFLMNNYEAMEWEDLERQLNLTKEEISYVVTQLRTHSIQIPRRSNRYHYKGYWANLATEYRKSRGA